METIKWKSLNLEDSSFEKLTSTLMLLAKRNGMKIMRRYKTRKVTFMTSFNLRSTKSASKEEQRKENESDISRRTECIYVPINEQNMARPKK